MRKIVLATTILMLASGSAYAFHKPDHKTEFPGAPSDQFVLFPILAGATCTDPIAEPEGLNAVPHGGPKKYGFIGEEFIETVDVSEGVVQFCLVEGVGPLEGDVFVRVSFEPEAE
jgi:hypothetical protein